MNSESNLERRPQLWLRKWSLYVDQKGSPGVAHKGAVITTYHKMLNALHYRRISHFWTRDCATIITVGFSGRAIKVMTAKKTRTII
jgi:hypothetical protein